MLGVCDAILFVVWCDCGVMFGYCLVVLSVFCVLFFDVGGVYLGLFVWLTCWFI